MKKIIFLLFLIVLISNANAFQVTTSSEWMQGTSQEINVFTQIENANISINIFDENSNLIDKINNIHKVNDHYIYSYRVPMNLDLEKIILSVEVKSITNSEKTSEFIYITKADFLVKLINFIRTYIYFHL